MKVLIFDCNQTQLLCCKTFAEKKNAHNLVKFWFILFNCFSNFLLELYMHVCRFQSIMFMFHNHLQRLSSSIKKPIIKRRSEKTKKSKKSKALFKFKIKKKTHKGFYSHVQVGNKFVHSPPTTMGFFFQTRFLISLGNPFPTFIIVKEWEIHLSPPSLWWHWED